MPTKSKNQGFFKPRNPKKYKGDPSQIVYRSGWELHVMQYFDKHPAITKWASEELHIPYLDPVTRKFRRYFPDFLIEKKDPKTGQTETILIEVKPFKETRPPPSINKNGRKRNQKTLITETKTYATNQAKWKAAKEWCDDRKIKFVVLTENEIYGKT